MPGANGCKIPAEFLLAYQLGEPVVEGVKGEADFIV